MQKNKVVFGVLLLAIITCLSFDKQNVKTDALPASSPILQSNTNEAFQLYHEVFNDTVYHEFIVKITKEEWDGISQDMIDYANTHGWRNHHQQPWNGDCYRTGNYRKAKLIYRSNGKELVVEEVGIRTRGNESRRLPQKDGKYYKSHFKIKFNERFDMDSTHPEYKTRNKRRFANMKSLNFRWTVDGPKSDHSKIREKFSYHLLDNAGVTVPKASLATLKFIIDGEEVDYGIYGIVEQIDKEFLTKRYGNTYDNGDLYKCLYLGTGAFLTPETLTDYTVGVKSFDRNYRPTYDLKTNKKNADYTNLRNFVDSINTLEGEKFVNYMKGNFEVDKFIRNIAMGIYICNFDDYRYDANNYYLYFNNKGKIEFIPYDFDIALGGGWDGEQGYEKHINQDIFNTANIPELWGVSKGRPLVDKVLEVEEYRNLYLTYLEEFANPKNSLFVYSEYEQMHNQLAAIYAEKAANNTENADPMKLSGWEAQYFYDKTKNVLDQLGISHEGFEIK